MKKNIVAVLNRLNMEKGKTMLGVSRRVWNPWKILIATILSARSRDEVTWPLSEKLFRKYPNPKSLANANPAEVQKFIKPIGFYRNKSKSIMAASGTIEKKYRGKVPKTMHELIELPGVGRKVAGCVLVYAYGLDAIPVDTHVHRISNRLGWVKTKTPEQTEKCLISIIPKKYWKLVNDCFVWHGKTICRPIIPECSKCTIRKWCKRVGVIKSK